MTIMASADILLELDGIKGESGDSKHPDTIEVSKVSGLGVVNKTTPAIGGGGGSGKAIFHPLNCQGPMSIAYPALKDFCAHGTPIKKATLYIRKQGAGEQQEYLTYVMEHVLVKAVHPVITDKGSSIAFSLSYQTITQEYKPQKDDQSLGSAVKTGWNLKTNKKHG